MEYRKIITFLLITISIHTNNKPPENRDKKPPTNIFNYVYSGANAKNKPFHASNQENKMKQETSSNFWEKILSMAATGIGIAAGSVYIIKSMFGGKVHKSTEDLKKEITQLKALIRKMNTLQKFREALSKICAISKLKSK